MQVVTLDKETFINKCSELSAKIETPPELIVGILNGGRYIVDEIKVHFNGSKNYLVQPKRKIGLLDYFAHSFVLKFLSNRVLNNLRIYLDKKARKNISRLSLGRLSEDILNFNFDDDFDNKSIKNILIVDDAIDTGRTMFIVKNNLSRLFPKAEIKMAVISWTIETSIIKPDYYVFKKVLVRFPWSKDYKGKDFE